MTEQAKVEIVLTYNGETVATNEDELREFCEMNIDEDDVYSYLDDEYGYIYIGNQTYDASDVVRNCGDIEDFYGDYVDSAFNCFSWDDLDVYQTGEIFEMCGIEFQVLKKVTELSEEEKAEIEAEKIADEKMRFESMFKALIQNIPTNYPHCADLGYIIPILCTELSKAIEEKKRIEAMSPEQCADELSKLLNKEGA